MTIFVGQNNNDNINMFISMQNIIPIRGGVGKQFRPGTLISSRPVAIQHFQLMCRSFILYNNP